MHDGLGPPSQNGPEPPVSGPFYVPGGQDATVAERPVHGSQVNPMTLEGPTAMNDLSRAFSALLSAVVVLALVLFPMAGGALWAADWYFAREEHVLDLTGRDYYLAGVVVSFVVLMGQLLVAKIVAALHDFLELLPGDPDAADDDEEPRSDGGGGTPLPQGA